jgi:recombinational DNA repair protein RecR
LISPIDNIFADRTRIPELLYTRIPELINELKQNQTIELIIFFKASFAADATLAYIKDYIRSENLQSKISITKLAEGLPLYYNPDNLDSATVIKALEDRRGITI